MPRRAQVHADARLRRVGERHVERRQGPWSLRAPSAQLRVRVQRRATTRAGALFEKKFKIFLHLLKHPWDQVVHARKVNRDGKQEAPKAQAPASKAEATPEAPKATAGKRNQQV